MPKDLKCERCGKPLVNKEHLRRHMDRHREMDALPPYRNRRLTASDRTFLAKLRITWPEDDE